MADLEGVVAGEYGRTITLTLKNKQGTAQDLTSYTGELLLIFRAPKNRKFITSTAAFVNTGSDGLISFAFTSDSTPDLNGQWKGQAELSNAGATLFAKTWPFTMDVEEALGQL